MPQRVKRKRDLRRWRFYLYWTNQRKMKRNGLTANDLFLGPASAENIQASSDKAIPRDAIFVHLSHYFAAADQVV